jgi:hypothetical protein
MPIVNDAPFAIVLMALRLLVGVAVGVKVDVLRAVTLANSGVFDATTELGDCVLERVAVRIIEGVDVSVGVSVIEGVDVSVGVSVIEGVDVSVGVVVGVLVSVNVGVAVGVCVDVYVGVWVFVGVRENVRVNVSVADPFDI